jgi:uncharacterized protein YndB with AHSA1/START domain
MTQQSEGLELRLERVVRASPERVFEAWTRPEELERWSAPEGLRVERGSLDLRVGGSWKVVMVAPDGARHEAFGTYREISPPSRLVYSHQWKGEDGASPETLLTLEFEPVAGGTKIVLVQVGFGSAEIRDAHDEGWSSALDNLHRLLEERAGAADR